MAEPNSVAGLLRRHRSERGESLRSAARELGVDPAYLSRVENGAQAPSEAFQERARTHYEVDADIFHLASGRAPPDVIDILQKHPELLDALRMEYGGH